jgi:hypothetical protein
VAALEQDERAVELRRAPVVVEQVREQVALGEVVAVPDMRKLGVGLVRRRRGEIAVALLS